MSQDSPLFPAKLATRQDRRGILKVGASIAGTAALISAIRAITPAGAWAAGTDGIEKPKLTLGFIPLTDCAPLVIASEKGFFKKHSLDVTLSKEASWANIRDKVMIGALDGAHMLAGMPLAATLGIGAIQTPTVTGFSMDLNGNAITVSTALYDRMVEIDPEGMKKRPISAAALKKVIDADKKAGKEPLTFAMVFPVSTHNYELRYWMASAGIDPDEDVRLIVIPPPQMVANLQAGNIQGYCVGEPWNARAVQAGIGRTLVTNHDIWNNKIEKVFGVNQTWADANPNTHKALIRALIETAKWMDEPGNRMEVVEIISQKSYVNAPPDVVKMSMTGTFQYAPKEAPLAMPDFNVFHRYAANFPWRSQAVWYLTQMARWGQIERPVNFAKTAEAVFRTDIYRDAAKELGVAYPTVDWKSEGGRAEPWTLADATQPIAMGPDKFLDGRTFDPADPVAYLRGFEVSKLRIDLDALAQANV
ncbi:myristoyl transferase [Skermanella stibiiresistens SB22]|uniref:Myristoyl transferase n=1 Tax=Skermanella stibiiresistens SB22 TaxID=1385369 RepID=W9H6J2_9PROT|nr:CmpA/NrtA family ABC transporter substrate-binding protein [Skermanella stibiiresistens]EWY39393.1 myristoyl transferase [Skermanella stibiiresistens SB22]